MQIYVSIGRFTLRLAASLDGRIASPDPDDEDDTSVDLEDEHPRTDESPRVVGFTRNPEAV